MDGDAGLADMRVHMGCVCTQQVNDQAAFFPNESGLIFEAQIADHKAAGGVVDLAEKLKVLLGHQRTENPAHPGGVFFFQHPRCSID